jgi:ribosomal-protein-alanine N-acetyltransferase
LTLLIRPVIPSDLPALVEIEQACFSVPTWAAKDFLADQCRVAELDGQIAGFLISRQIFPGDAQTPAEREILNVAVRPISRRVGIASALLRHELRHRATFFLEVRESNVAAQTLYKRFGFVEITRRQAYYRTPVETAIVMCLKWC